MEAKAQAAKLGARATDEPQLAAANFRTKIKDRVAVAMARGWARQLAQVGHNTPIGVGA